MDDVWGNAWAQPEEDVAHSVPARQDRNDVPSWSFHSTAKDEEADVGMPSWSTGELNWTEFTGQASLWSSASAVDDITLGMDGWGTSSTLKPNLDLADTNGPSDSDIRTVGVSGSTNQNNVHRDEEEFRSSTPISARTVTSVTGDEPSASIARPASPPPDESSSSDVPESSDAFGSFEVGLPASSTSCDESKITWTSPVVVVDDANPEEDSWGSAWRTPDLANTHDEERKDEWTIAREQKARRDRTVPPEILAAVLDHVNDLTATLYAGKENDLRFDRDLGKWRNGMANVTGLEGLMQRALPEVPGQPPIQFSKSHTAKAMMKSIKLSKNLPVVRNSPMSHLFTAKSLAAWELSVKSKVEVPKDDVPAGWRTIEPEDKKTPKPQPVEKKSSGIFSFFSKRSSAAPAPSLAMTGTDSRRSSLSREVSSDTASASNPARNSADAHSLSSKMKQSSSVSSFTSIVSPALSSPTGASSSSKQQQSPSPAYVSEQAHAPSSEQTSPPATSAVSRFLNRFSRARSDTRSSSSSRQNSVALSTDDLEFLSDIVPSQSDDVEENEQLSSLTAFVSSPAVPTELPPPLAPPPSAPPRPTSTSLSHVLQPRQRSLLSSPLLPTDQTPGNFSELKGADMLSIGKQTTQIDVSNGSAAPVLPPALPPPLSPTFAVSLSKPSTPAPLSGGAAPTHRSTGSSASAPVWSRPASASPSRNVMSPPAADFTFGSSSPLSCSVSADGRSPVRTPSIGQNPQKQLQTNFSPLSPVPPPIDKSPNRLFKWPTTNLVDEDDEFSNFQGHDTLSILTSQMNDVQTSQFDKHSDVFPSKTTLSRNDVSRDDLFGGFDTFVNHSTSQVPLHKPILPTSPPPTGIPPPLPMKHTPANLNTLHVRKPSAADHDATARLLERAAARPGPWPAPPSPLPNPLPPPPSSDATSGTSTSNPPLLELDVGGTAQAPTAPVTSITLKPIVEIRPSTATMLKSVSPPPLLPPPGSSSRQPSVAEASLMDFEDFSQPVQTFTSKSQTASPPPVSSAGTAKSGLSAQDLSFFEGL